MGSSPPRRVPGGRCADPWSYSGGDALIHPSSQPRPGRDSGAARPGGTAIPAAGQPVTPAEPWTGRASHQGLDERLRRHEQVSARRQVLPSGRRYRSEPTPALHDPNLHISSPDPRTLRFLSSRVFRFLVWRSRLFRCRNWIQRRARRRTGIARMTARSAVGTSARRRGHP